LLRWRLISAAVILSVLFALLALDFRQVIFRTPGVWLLPIMLPVVVLATEEMLNLLQNTGFAPRAPVVYAGNVLILLAACGPMWLKLLGRSMPHDNPLGPFGWPLMALAISAIAVFMAEIGRYRQPGSSVMQIALAMLVLVYVGLLSSFLAMLRLFSDNAWGMTALVSMLLVTKVADAAAYATGRKLGRHKMTPVVSPGKTWEGALGGLLAACASSCLFFHFLAPQIVGTAYVEPDAWASLLYGLLVALAGMAGDLSESLLKRDMQRKDSSSWLPGLGGVLDIMDAILFAAPVAWLCWAFGLVGPR
jgi:phosphatidate cytidylyltransferase